MSDLRTRRRAETHSRIIEAVHRVLSDEHPTELSMPRVAEASGVSLRTLYRYFPTKADLVDAASRSFQFEVVAELGLPDDLDDLEPHLVATWRRFDDDLPAVLAQHTTPAGRELRQRRLPRSRAHVASAIAAAAPGLGRETLDDLVDTVVLLTSSATYLELTQHQGHPSEQAARLAMAAVRAVVVNATGGTR